MTVPAADLRLAADAAIDLHLHTTHSDGRWKPEALLDHLGRERFDLVAVADHDRVDTVAGIQQLAQEKDLPVLAAVEMTTSWQGALTDLLCYGFDAEDNALRELAQDLLRRQQENTREVYENLQRKGYVLPGDALPALLTAPSSWQPFALVALLEEQGYGLGEPPAGRIAFEAGCAFATSEPAAVVEAAHRSGAVCLLAHPGRGDGFTTYDVELLDQFRQEVPIDGLEAYYPRHTPAQTEMYRAYAERHQLLISAGSDSHGPDKPPVKYRAELCSGLLERMGVRIE